MGKWRSRLYKTDRARDFDHERDRQVRARQVYETIDRQPFQWIIVLVAGIGFFLDGYTLFASNIALPMIAYVYWRDDGQHDRTTWINVATLAGTMIGQVLFGVLADRKGRKKMYGIELVVLVVSTLGVVMASTGTRDSMSIFAWLIVWRFVSGIGVGGDYPLSAVITSEFAPTAHRARMMAVVFFMQSLGQVAGNIAAMVVIIVTRKTLGETDLDRAADIMWRWIIGIGVFPGVLAILFRLAIPETPRFMLEVEADPVKAECDATTLFGAVGEYEEDLVSPAGSDVKHGTWMLDNKTAASINLPTPTASPHPYSHHNTYTCNNSYDEYDEIEDLHDHAARTSALASADWTITSTPPPNLNSKWSLTRADIHQYFVKEKNYITLIATSLAWFFLDFGFFGIDLSSPQFLARTWGSLNIAGPRPAWQISDDPSTSIYDSFLDTSIHALVILNMGSVIGSALLIITVNRINRVVLQRCGFLALAAIFIVMGVTFMSVPHREGPLAVTLYIVAQILFNFGPNATTYILPAELFPTRYRATCHGIAAAAGKFGSILMQIIQATAMRPKAHTSSGQFPQTSSSSHQNQVVEREARLLIGFAAVMLAGFVVSLWIPKVQEKLTQPQPSTASKRSSNKPAATPAAAVTATTTNSASAPAAAKAATTVATPTNASKASMFGQLKIDTAVVSGVVVGKGFRSKTLEELSYGRAGRKGEVTMVREMRNAWV